MDEQTLHRVYYLITLLFGAYWFAAGKLVIYVICTSIACFGPHLMAVLAQEEGHGIIPGLDHSNMGYRFEEYVFYGPYAFAGMACTGFCFAEALGKTGYVGAAIAWLFCLAIVMPTAFLGLYTFTKEQAIKYIFAQARTYAFCIIGIVYHIHLAILAEAGTDEDTFKNIAPIANPWVRFGLGLVLTVAFMQFSIKRAQAQFKQTEAKE